MNKRRNAIIVGIFVVVAVVAIAIGGSSVVTPNKSYKPVLYLYAPEPTTVHVSLDYAGSVDVTYPDVDESAPSWTVTTRGDGRLDHQGRVVPSLFWEGTAPRDYRQDEGFVVAAADTVSFLEEKLAALGLTDVETAEFITFWAPRMTGNPYNLVTFATDQYVTDAHYSFSVEPTTMLRVYMVTSPLDRPIDVPVQTLPAAPQRVGLTAVEWGGQEQRSVR